MLSTKLLRAFNRLALLALATLCLGGCAGTDPGPPKVPLSVERYGGGGMPKRDRMLLVFLPGRGTTGRDFVRQKFVQASVSSTVDAVTVDLTFPYYEQRMASERLRADVIAPARAAGYRHIWLVGVSMGGLGAIMYDAEHPGEISGIVAIAPFLGEKPAVEEIEAAGGLASWQPKLPLADDDFQRRLWLTLRAGRYGQPGHLPLILGYGTSDRFAYGHRLLAANLPSDRVFETFGFHDWATWHRLWIEILRSPVSPLADGNHPR